MWNISIWVMCACFSGRNHSGRMLYGAVFLLMRVCRTLKDTQGFVLVLSFALFTVVEAHAVSVYLARNYVLFLLGAYWTAMLPLVEKQSGGGSCRGLFGARFPKQQVGSFGRKADGWQLLRSTGEGCNHKGGCEMTERAAGRKNTTQLFLQRTVWIFSACLRRCRLRSRII